MQSKNTSVRSTGLANITLSVQDTLDVRISGTGQVCYYGNPAVEKKISGLGRVKQLSEAKPV